LSWCSDIPSGHVVVKGCEDTLGSWYVVLDAAALVSTSPLKLFPSGPHFVTLSFYKMFGFPTGLGALLVRRDCASLLGKAYYGGGTVKATDSWKMFHVARDQLHER
jgi:molybdenum cofactor sulfurtransferase